MIQRFFSLSIFVFVFCGFLAVQIVSDYLSTQAGIVPQGVDKQKLYRENFKIFEGLSHDGQTIKLSKIKAPVVILNFWADWCFPCLEEFPSLVELRKRYKEDQIYILGISESGSKKIVKDIYKKYKLNFPSILGGQKWIEKYNVQNFPFSVIYFADKVVAKEGKKDFLDQKLLDEIAKFLPQK